jgi:hypothetical protein
MLFDKQDIPRSKRIKRMRIYDVSFSEEITMECSHCGYSTGWIYVGDKTRGELIKGLPCPKCNEEKDNE